jgi:hypothetical protein
MKVRNIREEDEPRARLSQIKHNLELDIATRKSEFAKRLRTIEARLEVVNAALASKDERLIRAAADAVHDPGFDDVPF